MNEDVETTSEPENLDVSEEVDTKVEEEVERYDGGPIPRFTTPKNED
jgi:hypothetical protein